MKRVIPKKAFLVLSTIYLVLLIYPCFATDFIFLEKSKNSSDLMRQLNFISRFYGLNTKRFIVRNDQNNHQIMNDIKYSNSKAVIINSDVFPYMRIEELFATLDNKQKEDVKFLITGITSDIDSNLLRDWSGGAVVGCNVLINIPAKRFLKVSGPRNITLELSGQQVPFTHTNGIGAYYFTLDKDKKYQSILELSGGNNKLFTVLIKTKINGYDLFLQTEMVPNNSHEESSRQYGRNNFFEIVPLMIFLRYACGNKCWHNPEDFANLIIDDPWLTEPYGNLNYKQLLKEMEKVNFHTTIAFIPWNYDRSKPEVATLFRNHLERFSLCIHGNNHDHYEFYKYKIGPSDPWPAKSLNIQEANIKQALARMEKFRNLTGLSYDKVMVFPHDIAPAKTLGLLKKYNFLATFNASNVPLGSSKPPDLLFPLRNVTLRYENFPSLKRYSPNRIKSDIAIDLFLDNPLIFWTHHDFFQKGVNAFNKTARIVNEIEPDIIWQGLGYIAQHLYLEKLRDDCNYDLLAFTSDFIIENTHQHDLTYFVRKDEDFSIPIKKVTVDGQLYSYEKSGNNILLKVFVPSKQSRHIIIEYENDLDISAIDISKNDPHVNRLRKLSDFRDMTLSKNIVGRTISNIYYDTGFYKLGIVRLAILSAIIIILTVILAFGTIYFIRKKRSSSDYK